MASKYGIPYMGSKSSILKKLCQIFPNADNFYDLFGGGFSVSHFMLENRNKDFKTFHYNEIRKGVPDLVKDAIAGKYNYSVFKPEFVTREMFSERKDKCAYTKILWSFGNNGEGYLFGRGIEAYKKSLHNAIIFNEFDSTAKEILGIEAFSEEFSVKDRRLFLGSRVRIQQLERLEQLQQLERLEQLERLRFYNTSYEQVEVLPNSIIYCDPPYIGTAKYDGVFDHKSFYDWAASHETPIFISEYSMPDKRLKRYLTFKKRSLLSAKGDNLIKNENIYVNKAAIKLLKERKDGKAP